MLTETYIEKMRSGLISTELIGKKYGVTDNFSHQFLSSNEEPFSELQTELGLTYINNNENPDYIFIYINNIDFNNEIFGTYDGSYFYSDLLNNSIELNTINGQLAQTFVFWHGLYKNSIVFCSTIPFSNLQTNGDMKEEEKEAIIILREKCNQLNFYIRKIATAFDVKIIEVNENKENELLNKTIKSLLY